MSELKHTFTSGRMNKDLDERLIPNGEYRDALNIQVSTSEGSDVGAIENVLGNKELFNLSLTNALCIGTAKDLLNKKIYWFVTADELDGIYEYDTLNDTILPVLIDIKNTNIDIINNVSFLSDSNSDLIINNSFQSEFEEIFGLLTLPTKEDEEALVTKNVDITIENLSDKISIPKGTIICLDDNNNYIFKNIKYRLNDLGNLVVIFTHSDGAVLSFSKNNIINGSNVIDGLLFFTDNLNEPRVIDIEKFKFYSKSLVDSDGTISKNSSTKIATSNSGLRDLIEEDITVAVISPQTSPTIEIKDSLREGIVSTLLANHNFFSTGQGTNNKLILPNDQNNTFRINYSANLDWKIGDNISFEPTGDLDDFSAIATIKDIELNPTIITFQILSYINADNIENKNYEIEQELIEDDPIYELKFPRFGYRWKYDDNRFSTFSPFSETAFFPDEFEYDGKKGFNKGIINRAKRIILKDIDQGSDRVKQIDLLLKFDDDNNVYILESKKKKYIDANYIFEITKEQIKSTVDNKQLLRQWDNIPKRAKTQEITGNRIIYGNYFQNYNIYDDPKFQITLTGRDDNLKRSLKSNRNYEIGVVYVDKFNRQTPVLSDDSGSYFINKNQAPNQNAFNIKLTNNPPAWATHFKYFIKETSAEYYNLAADRFYFDNKNGYVYVSFSSAERNKITEDTYLLVKKTHGEDTPITSTNNRFKVLEIFSEPPEFVHERLSKIDALSNVLFAQAYGASSVEANRSAGSTPVKDNSTVQIHSVASSGTTSSAPSGDYGFDDITKTNIKVGKYVRFEAQGKRTNKYQIKALRYHTDGQDELELKFEKPFGDDVDILYQDSTDALKADITLEIYEDTAFAGDPEFNGRFFVKLEVNNTLNSIVPENELTDENVKYQAIMSVNFDGKDRSSRNFMKDKINATPIFVAGGGSTPGDPDNDTTFSKFESDNKDVHITFHQTGPSDEAGAEFINKLELGDRLKFSNQETLYRVGRLEKKQAKFRFTKAEGRTGSQKHPTWGVKILFTEEDGTETPLQKKVHVLDPKKKLKDFSGLISVSIMRPDEDGESVFTPNPAIFETEPIRQKTELDIYFETEKAFSIAKHGEEQKLNWYNCFSFGNGVESNRIRDDFNAPFIKNGVKASTILEEGYEEEHKFNGLIFSGVINSKSSVNNSNQFLQAESITKDFLPSYGKIQKLHSWDDSLVVFLENKVLRAPANKSALFNADGSTNLIASSNVVGNPIEYNGEYGISNDPQSFAFFGFRCYFVDRKNGKVFRLSKDGLTPISDVNMGDFFSDRLETTQTIFGSFDEDNQLYNLSFGTDADTVCFSEAVNGWTTRKSFVPEFAVSMNSKYYTFNTGNIFLHGHSGAIRNNFYGVQSFSQVQFEINEDPSTVKKFKTLVYEGTKGWTADIKTDLEKSNDISFKSKENKYFANISGETKTASNLDLKKFNFQGIGRPSSMDTIVDNRPNTTYNFSTTLLNPLDINSSTVSLPQNKPGEVITKNTVTLILSPKTAQYKLLATDFTATNGIFSQDGDNVKLTYTHGFKIYPDSTTDIQIPIFGGRLVLKDVTLSGSYTVNLSGCEDNIGNDTYEITDQPGKIVTIISREINALAGFELLKNQVTIDNPKINNTTIISQLANNKTTVSLVEKTVMPQFDEINRNYIIKGIGEEIIIPPKFIISKSVIGSTTLANLLEARSVIVKGDSGAKLFYKFDDGSATLQEESLTIPNSEELNIDLEFTASNFDVAKTYTLTFRLGNETEFGTNFGSQTIVFTRAAATSHIITVKAVHGDVSTTKKFGLQEYSVTNTRGLFLTNESIQLTLNSSFVYDKLIKTLTSADFQSLTRLDNTHDLNGNNTIQFSNIKLEVGATSSTDHIVTLTYDIKTEDINADHEFEINLDDFVNKTVQITFAYLADQGGTETVGSSGNYTAALSGAQTRTGITNTIANREDTFVTLTCNSNNEFEPGLGFSVFRIFDSGVNDVTNTYTGKGYLPYRIDRANNTAVIHVQSKGFQFPSANLNLFIRPFTPIVRTVVSANNFTFQLDNIYGKAVKAPTVGSSLNELLTFPQFKGSATGEPWIARDTTKALINGPRNTKIITETASGSTVKKLAQFIYKFNRRADHIFFEEGFARICKFGNASTYSSSYTLTSTLNSSLFELAPNGNSTQTDINGASKTITGPFEVSDGGLTLTVNVLLNITAITSASATKASAKLQVALDMEEDFLITSGHLKPSKKEACESSNAGLHALVYSSHPDNTFIGSGDFVSVLDGGGSKPWNTAGTAIPSRQIRYIKNFTNDKIISLEGNSLIKEITSLCPGQPGPVPFYLIKEIRLSNTITRDTSRSRPQVLRPYEGPHDAKGSISTEAPPYLGTKKLLILRKRYDVSVTNTISANDRLLKTNYPFLFDTTGKFDRTKVIGGNNNELRSDMPAKSMVSFGQTIMIFKGDGIIKLFEPENFVGVWNFFSERFMTNRAGPHFLRADSNDSRGIFQGSSFFGNDIFIRNNAALVGGSIGLRGKNYYKLQHYFLHRSTNLVYILLNDLYTGSTQSGAEIQFVFRKSAFHRVGGIITPGSGQRYPFNFSRVVPNEVTGKGQNIGLRSNHPTIKKGTNILDTLPYYLYMNNPQSKNFRINQYAIDPYGIHFGPVNDGTLNTQ